MSIKQQQESKAEESIVDEREDIVESVHQDGSPGYVSAALQQNLDASLNSNGV